MMGVVIGDNLGMPVQFWSREEIKEDPVISMRGYGTYNMPPGTWSDDSSMAIATLDSILKNHGIYFFMVKSILDSKNSLLERLQEGMKQAAEFYKKDISNLKEWSRYGRLENLLKFAEVSEDEIRSTGYVVDTLEAAVWSLITTSSLEEGLLKAVNLGDDTDTVGAVAGGLAGLYYGYDSIPNAWKEVIIKGDEIVEMCKMVDEEFEDINKEIEE